MKKILIKVFLTVFIGQAMLIQSYGEGKNIETLSDRLSVH